MTEPAVKTSAISRVAPGIAFGLRLALGGLLLVAAQHKIAAPSAFLETVYGYELVGPRVGLWVATMLPALEIVLGACLIAGVAKALTAALTTLLVAAFLVAQVSAMARGLSIDCGCFASDAGNTVGVLTLVRTSVILAAAVLLSVLTIFAGKRPGSLRFSSTVTDELDRLPFSGRPV